jgi:hypothetical protein
MNTTYVCRPPRFEFTTERLPLAIFIHATERLAYLRCDLSPRTGKIIFVFLDQNSQGPQVELEFDRGAAAPATAIFASQKFLRRTMTETLNKRSTDNRNDYSSRS